jgi:TonB family protein
MKKILLITALLLISLNVFSQSDSLQKDSVYFKTERMAEFKGGQQELFMYLSQNIKYPEHEMTEGKEGTVYVSFVIDKVGKVTNAKVIKGVTDNFNNEALRVVNQMPDWIPAEQDGKMVSVQFNMPIKFSLNVKDDEKKKN